MIVGDFVDCLEVYTPLYALKAMHIQVDIVCPDKKEGESVTTAVHEPTKFQTYEEKRGYKLKINKAFENLDYQSYDGIWVPGGRAPEYLRMNNKVVEIIRYFID